MGLNCLNFTTCHTSASLAETNAGSCSRSPSEWGGVRGGGEGRKLLFEKSLRCRLSSVLP